MAKARRETAMTHVVDGKAIAAAMNEQTARSAALLRERGVIPALAVVVATEDEGAAWYVRSIERAAAKVGIECRIHRLPPAAGGPDAVATTAASSALTTAVSPPAWLARDPAVHGIICQSPLPAGLALAAVGSSIAVRKDVDGANPASLGMLAVGLPDAFPPATAAAVMEIIRRGHVALVGINPTGSGGLVGDVDTAAVTGIASAITPVPGGVGPVTTAQLMNHTIRGATRPAR